jgi:hypothetical protein
MAGRHDYDELRNGISPERRGRNDDAVRQEMLRYGQERMRAVTQAAARGHHDQRSLRELLISTTDRNTAPVATAYFAEHRQDSELLRALMNIALEGEDAGDAPWAAANTIADFPANMLLPHRESLEKLAREQWEYLHVPAKIALAKIAAAGGGT